MPDPDGDGRVVPVADARKALGVTRPAMTHLVNSRQLVATTVNRRQCITLSSALRRLEAVTVPGAREHLLAVAVTPRR